MTLPHVIIPYRNGARWINALLHSLPAELDVLIVDDQSDEPMPRLKRKGVEVVKTPRRVYWAGACNYGASLRSRDLLFLNQDIVFQGDDWLARLQAAEASGIDITGNWVRGHPNWPEGYVDGVFMWVRRSRWDEAGGLDAARYPMWGGSCLLQAQICRAGGKAAPFDLSHSLKHFRHGNLGNSFRELLQDEVGHARNDGNVYRRVPPYVTVVIPAHGDYDKYLPDAVNSIRRQTRADWQIVISLDANARPELREMAAAYADPWQGIKAVQLPGKAPHGPPAVRNAGVLAAKARYYILMLDGDDYAEPNAIELLVAAAERCPGRYVYGDLKWVGDRGGVRRFPEFDYEALLQRNYIPSFILYPVRMWKETGGYPMWSAAGWDDYAFNVAAGLHDWCGVHVPEIVLNYRRHGHSRNHNSQRIRATLRGNMETHLEEAFDRRKRPMCSSCGKSAGVSRAGRAPNPAKRRNVTAPAGVGASGMVELRYVGSLGAAFTVRGPHTGARYRVYRGWVGWIDAQDAAALVGIGRDYEYTGRAAGKGKPFPAAVAPAVVEEPTFEVVTHEAKDAPQEESPAPVGEALTCPTCGAGPFKTQRGLDAHRRMKHEG